MTLSCTRLRGALSGLAICLLALAVPARAATPCIVLGKASARVSSVEGVRAPVFETADCRKLRLVSGHALASWVDADGKPQLVPITTSGVASSPRPGSEERSVRVAWSELTSTRADQKPAYMRGMGLPHPVAVYVPRGGLDVAGTGGKAVRVRIEPLGAGAAGQRVLVAASGRAVRLGRKLLHAGSVYQVEIETGGRKTQGQWRIVSAREQAEIDSRLQGLSRQIRDPMQRAIVTAMLYDQLKLETNLSLLAPKLRAMRVGSNPG